MRVGLSALRVKLGYLSGILSVDDDRSCLDVVGVCSLDSGCAAYGLVLDLADLFSRLGSHGG
jgi:hypothetical protein